MKVYIVMSLSYEGDFIVGVRDTMEKAEKLQSDERAKIEKVNGYELLEIEEWEVD